MRVFSFQGRAAHGYFYDTGKKNLDFYKFRYYVINVRLTAETG